MLIIVISYYNIFKNDEKETVHEKKVELLINDEKRLITLLKLMSY